MQIILKEIGKVRKEDELCWLEIEEQYKQGLKDIEYFSHIIVLWWIHQRDTKANREVLVVSPPTANKNVITGVFSTRSPSRPNPIGLTVVKLTKVEDRKIFIDRIDAFDETPVLDIKPYLPGDSKPIGEIKLPPWFDHLFPNR